MTKLDQDGLIPPSDPWHEAAPPPDPVWPPPVPDDPQPRPRTRWWLLILVAVVVVAVAFGVALRPVRSPEPARTPVAPPPAKQATSASPAAARTVLYAVTAGSGDIGSVQYTDQDGDIISRGGVPLPWRVTFHVTGDQHPFVLIAQRKKGGTGPVTCSITVGGEVLSSATETGRYAAPECAA
ncbi:MmpS family transport accessory protein [Paractinoplanes globisporus]|uniref:MmpS family transport accessory protein n=1 Tax=Paractinoplanes globisporus TaxID=113565 RepID=A0ABW6W4W8_9ACTN|nr:MmpS family transport accessory protein [Actinoplanes globisporus]